MKYFLPMFLGAVIFMNGAAQAQTVPHPKATPVDLSVQFSTNMNAITKQVADVIKALEQDDERQVEKLERFQVTVYQPFCSAHGGLASVHFARNGVAYPASIVCQDKFQREIVAPK